MKHVLIVLASVALFALAVAGWMLLVVSCGECAAYVDEGQIPVVEGDEADMGKLYPRIIVDGVKLNYEPVLRWYVDAGTRKAMVWEECYVEGDSIPKRLLLPRVDRKHSKIVADARDAALRAKGLGAGELEYGPGDPRFVDTIWINGLDAPPPPTQGDSGQ